MDLIVIFKAGIVGGFGFIIAIGIVMSLLISVSKTLSKTMVKTRKTSAFIIALIILIIGWSIAYLYLLPMAKVLHPIELRLFTFYACLFALVPSVAMVSGALFYYFDVQKAVWRKDSES